MQAFVDVNARLLIGIHWGTFDLAEEPLDEPPVRMLAEARRRGIDSERAWILNWERAGGKSPSGEWDFPSDEPLPFPGAD